jgi:hypothetical protein
MIPSQVHHDTPILFTHDITNFDFQSLAFTVIFLFFIFTVFDTILFCDNKLVVQVAINTVFQNSPIESFILKAKLEFVRFVQE